MGPRSTTHFFADLFFPLLIFFVDWPIPAALVPASAAPTTAPVTAPATAPVKTSRPAFFALLMMPGERELDFLLPLFLLDADETDFFAADRFFVFFLVAIPFLILSSDVNDFRSLGPLALANGKGCAARIRKGNKGS